MMRRRRRLGAMLVAAGFALLLAAGGLLWFNQAQSRHAEEACRKIVAKFAERLAGEANPLPQMQDYREQTDVPDSNAGTPSEADSDPTVRIDGVDYIGVISFPTLSLELPVMAQWSYEGMRTAPGRYSGSLRGENLVVAGHNYSGQLAQCAKLALGDEILFTDANGTVYRYAVLDIEILQPTAVAEMTAGEYPLTVFTCTYGGSTRLTIRCG